MKQLKKLRLNDFVEMTDYDMKCIIGGYTGSGTYDDPYGLPEINVFPSGPGCKIYVCASKQEGDKCAISYNGVVYPGTCQKDWNEDNTLVCKNTNTAGAPGNIWT